ncbi:hypothetical protein HMPREF0432_00731 [Gemella morbillorum M424]|jgi:hypothetical protein|nr:hypothetical protein HMPREF0432_00731 [Gemella morbillorum M424]
MDYDMSTLDLSFQDYEFLNSVNPEKVWTKTTNICTELGIKTLSGLVQISSQVFSLII